MVLPIFVYGNPVLRKKAVDIGPDYPKFNDFVTNLWDTLEKCDGLGLAAPQVGEAIRMFAIDGKRLVEDDPSMEGFRKLFINARILERSGEDNTYNEGCLSLPGIHEDVIRKSIIRINYQDENFVTHEETFDGLKARIIQHEYDHIDGILFVDHLSPLKRKMLKGKLTAIMLGKADAKFKMKLPKK